MARGTTLDFESIMEPHQLAAEISNQWHEWNNYRQGWIQEKKELRNYIYATDTSTTSNAKLPWSNSTTTPKLCQIYDNLKANYTAAIFPNSNWMRWEAEDKAAARDEKRNVIQAYMENKVRQSQFEVTMDRLIDDYILFGNCFATVEHLTDYTEVNGEQVVDYVGPNLVRISPYDIVFNPISSDFKSSPKIIRTLMTLGDAKKVIPEEDFNKMLNLRTQVGSADEVHKADGFVADGFSNIQHYYGSNYVELLTFYGDIYDVDSGEFKENRMITVADRAYIVSDEEIPSWLGSAPIFHSGWRSRPDNLYAMGPLDNLVGMQYRIDHLENLKADVFDQIALPVLKIRGEVEDFEYAPGERIIMGEEGDVAPLVPDATALNADFQIQNLENKMEELAGAPRQAMGIRTPGEKTAFEVQTLQNAAGRIFQNKAAKLEKEFIEPILNSMLESGRRNLDEADTIRVLDDEFNATIFKSITKEDITAKGKIIPVGARHFAERAQRVQNITQMLQLKADPTVGVHLSGKKIAEIVAYELGEDELYGENIAVEEQLETQRASQDAEAQNQEELQVAAESGL
jgi:hypothetical protein|tara:strand:- start:26273 stop:27988 length:1716 start_codon:yes stop_codon:yes gene_type:complete